MKKLLLIILLLSASFLFHSFTFAQTYNLQRGIGKINFSEPISVAVDTKGYKYVACSNGYVAKLDKDNKVQFLLNFTTHPDGIILLFLMLDSEENLWVGDRTRGRLQKFDSDGKLLLEFGSQGEKDGQFSLLGKFCFDSLGNILVVDMGKHCIQKFDKTGVFLSKFGSQGTANGKFYSPEGITIDREGNLWVTEYTNSRVQKFDKDGNFLLKFGSYGTKNGQFYQPAAIKEDADGNFWVADYNNYRLQKFDKNGKYLLKVTTYSISFGFHPLDLTIDHQGHIWTTDDTYGSIQAFNSTGQGETMFGSSKFFGDEIFAMAQSICVDIEGNTWVADMLNNRIQKFDATGKFLLSVGNMGVNNGEFEYPIDMAIDKLGNLLVTDRYNHRVQKFDKNGKFLSKFGSKGSGNGQFVEPQGIAIDMQGNIWIVDSGNYRVQKFDRDGNFLLTFGSKGSVGGDFHEPTSIVVDNQGIVWVMDLEFPSVKLFDEKGNYLYSFGGESEYGYGGFYKPSGMALDKQGYVWIADRHVIQRFAPGGRENSYISQIPLPNMRCSDLAFDQKGDLYFTSPFGAIVYTTNLPHTSIKGKVYLDKDQNCSFTNGDKPLQNAMVVANPGSYFAMTDIEGNYEILLDTGKYTVSQIIDTTSSSAIQPSCPATNVSSIITFTSKKDTTTHVDFANRGTLLPQLVSNVSLEPHRRCFISTIVISYSNTGYGDAENVKVSVKLPKYVVFKSADKPYTIDKDSNYVFTIDTLKSFHSGVIHITDSVVCIANITGLTLCAKAWITPANTYTLPPNSTWDNSDIVLTGKCIENGRVQMVIKNMGQSMADSAEFRILLDAQLAFRKNYKLAAGDSLVLKVPANGKTVRLEADQRPDHPRKSQTNLTIEGCVASSSDVVSKGFVDALPQDDIEPEVAIQCLPIVDSYDPNDKLVSPAGTTDEHYTPTTSELKYTIRFQNTGTDYAYTVVVIDTLSENLDIATLQMGAASHGYSLKVSGKGQPVLTWTFNNINLPDSTRDQKGSNGFIQFTIKPKANLPEKTQIENYADIFFDYNDPVRTNTTANVLYDVPKVIDAANQLSDSIIDKVMAAEPDALKGKLSLYPNPTQSQVWIQSVDLSVRIEQVKIYNLLGKAQNVSVSSADNQTVQINMQAKPKGMYLVHIQTNKGTSIQRVVVQ
ncbi:6-bladed beta-propeller [Cytophagaceae bacterium DM2B3-1]|uniref:6-bladed beta-propeller n=1 Tax=Xanthocytophaga flava TaxID=3048013 RepID=A0ABT7CMI9_9BACT|nr:6-bladed beta-propeller [Xanthocytophaga flavus]MDJ1494973.1 6-bladed beta-propeller [Xanthocytophaga flavus]